MIKKFTKFISFFFASVFTKDGVTLHPGRVLVIGFLLLISIGSILLSQPWATHQQEIRWIDAVFTATSAACVTGLTVLDTNATFTQAGQIVLLCMMEIGGIGIMTFGTFFILMLGGRMSFGDREFFKETVSHRGLTNIFKLLMLIIATVFIVEAIGAVLLFLRFVQIMPSDKAVFYGIFYAISGFCNAGFTLFSNSLMQFRGDYYVCLVIMSLVIIGGIGFLVYGELFEKAKGLILRKKTAPLSLQTKLVITTTSILIIAGAAFICFLENENSLAGLTWDVQWLDSIFQSAASRTAGFNTIDITLITNGTALILIVLMFVGGAPASCAGGIKTTTFSIITALIVSKMKGRSSVSIMKRNIPSGTIAKALSVFFASCLFVFIATMILEITETAEVFKPESRDQFVALFFETVSAFGTVGLSMGITPMLSFAGKWVIIICMFVGRIGPMVLALAIISEEKPDLFQYPDESVMTG